MLAILSVELKYKLLLFQMVFYIVLIDGAFSQ